MSRSPSPVLRQVVLQEQPRALRVPGPAAGREPTGTAAPPSPSEAGLRAALESAYQEGREAGREEGRLEGIASGKAALEARQRDLDAKQRDLGEQQARAHEVQLARLERLLDDLHGAFEQRLDSLQHDAVELAYAAVCRLVGEDASSPARIAGLVSQALHELRSGPVLAIRLSEADLALMTSSDVGQALLAKHPEVAWRADAGLSDGGCVLDLPHGSLDARLGLQVERLRSLWSAAAAAPTALREGGLPCRP